MRSQLETERADRDRCRTFLFKGKNCIGSGKNEKSAPIVIGVEVRSQVETERADQERIGAELLPAKEKFCSGRHTLGEVRTRRGHNFQPARPPSAKNLPQCGRDVKKILEILEASSEN